MAYSEDLKLAAVKRFQDSAGTYVGTGRLFGVSATSVKRWAEQYEKTGDLSAKPLSRKPKKLDPDKLRAYVKDHPDATQQEIADEFGCCNQAVSKALRRLNITRKKKRAATKNGIRRK